MSSEPIRMRDGSQALRIQCNYSMSNCREEARKKCENGYDIVSKGDRSSADCPPHTGETAPQACDSVYVGVLVVKCK